MFCRLGVIVEIWGFFEAHDGYVFVESIGIIGCGSIVRVQVYANILSELIIMSPREHHVCAICRRMHLEALQHRPTSIMSAVLRHL